MFHVKLGIPNVFRSLSKTKKDAGVFFFFFWSDRKNEKKNPTLDDIHDYKTQKTLSI